MLNEKVAYLKTQYDCFNQKWCVSSSALNSGNFLQYYLYKAQNIQKNAYRI